MRFGILLSLALGALVVAIAVAVAVAPSPVHAQQRPTVWDGAYTLAQAKRGAVKSGLCTTCHGDGFENGLAPPLVGPQFLARWEGRSLADLFDLIRLTMPDDDPGVLPRETYADLVAYLLSLNKFPAGHTEIGTAIEPLKSITILASKP